MATIYDHFPDKHMVMPWIATTEDIIREYNSIDNFKSFMTGSYVKQIRLMGETMLSTMDGVPPTLMLLSKKPGQDYLDIFHLQIDPFMQTEPTKKTIPFFLRTFIGRNYARNATSGSKIYGLLFYSEAWATSMTFPATQTEVTLKQMPADDPERKEVVLVTADFIFGGAIINYELARPKGKPPHLKDMPGYSELRFGDPQNNPRGMMVGLLRKTAAVYNPGPPKIKINR